MGSHKLPEKRVHTTPMWQTMTRPEHEPPDIDVTAVFERPKGMPMFMDSLKMLVPDPAKRCNFLDLFSETVALDEYKYWAIDANRFAIYLGDEKKEKFYENLFHAMLVDCFAVDKEYNALLEEEADPRHPVVMFQGQVLRFSDGQLRNIDPGSETLESLARATRPDRIMLPIGPIPPFDADRDALDIARALGRSAPREHLSTSDDQSIPEPSTHFRLHQRIGAALAQPPTWRSTLDVDLMRELFALTDNDPLHTSLHNPSEESPNEADARSETPESAARTTLPDRMLHRNGPIPVVDADRAPFNNATAMGLQAFQDHLSTSQSISDFQLHPRIAAAMAELPNTTPPSDEDPMMELFRLATYYPPHPPLRNRSRSRESLDEMRRELRRLERSKWCCVIL